MTQRRRHPYSLRVTSSIISHTAQVVTLLSARYSISLLLPLRRPSTIANKAEPNPSRRTQIDGTLEKDGSDKEATRKVVADFVGDILRGENPDNITNYFDGDKYIQHNTGIADGLSGLGKALAALAEQGIQMIYNKTYMVLADENYGLAVSEGTFGGAPTAYYDLFRVENGKIAEHWDVMETIADKETWANENGKF